MILELKQIKAEPDYNKSIKRIEELLGAKKNISEVVEFDLLCTLVESFEMTHYPIVPTDSIKFRMEQMGMTKTDIAKYLRSQVNCTVTPFVKR